MTKEQDFNYSIIAVECPICRHKQLSTDFDDFVDCSECGYTYMTKEDKDVVPYDENDFISFMLQTIGNFPCG